MAGCQDNSFGPYAGPECRGGFDFTLKFEEIVMTLVPATIFLLVATIIIICLLWTRGSVGAGVGFDRLSIAKRMASGMLCIQSLALLVCARYQTAAVTRLMLATTAVLFVENVALAAWSTLEHQRSAHPSLALNTYLVCMVLLQACRVRSLWLADTPLDLSILTTTSLATRLALLTLESVDKPRPEETKGSPNLLEDRGSFPSRVFFGWLVPLLRQGYSGILSAVDFSGLETDRTQQERQRRFTAAVERRRGTPASKFHLITILIYCNPADFVGAIVFRLSYIAALFAQPFLIQDVLNFLEDGSMPLNRGYGLIGAFGLIYLFIAIFTAHYAHCTNRFALGSWALLVNGVVDATLNAPVATIPQPGKVGAAVNVDAANTVQGFRAMHDLWASFVTVALCLWLLYLQLGLAFVAPLLSTIVFTALTVSVSPIMIRRQRSWVEATERRLGVIIRTISSIKEIKMMGLGSRMEQSIQQLRRDEVRMARYEAVSTHDISHPAGSYQGATFVTYGAFAIICRVTGTTLNTYNLDMSLSVLSIMTSPLYLMIQQAPVVVAGLNSLQRLDAVLKLPRVPNTPAQDVNCVAGPIEDKALITLQEATLDWDGNSPVLEDVNLQVFSGQFHAIVGPTGSGKSTLLRALLGELNPIRGVIRKRVSGGIAYCAQKPWLMNGTIRSNVIGTGPFEPSWYQQVLFACDLDKDLASFPQRDQTSIGSAGVALSGGQKQRVGLARALYARSELLILDDILGGLDNTTQHNVIERVFGAQGVARQACTTTVVVTHHATLISLMDTCLLCGDGRVEAQNSSTALHKLQRVESADTLDEKTESHDQEASSSMSHQAEGQYVAEGVEQAETEDQPKRSDPESWRLYRYYMQLVGNHHTLLFIILSATVAGVSVYQQYWLTDWADAESNRQLSMYITVYLGMLVATLIVIFGWCSHFLDIMIQKASLQLHEAQLLAFLRAPISFLMAAKSGALANRFTQDIMLVDDELPLALLNTVSSFFSVLAEVVVVFVACPIMAAVTPALFIVFWVLQSFYLRTSRQLRVLEIEAKAPLYQHTLQCAEGLATIRAFGWTAAQQTESTRYVNSAQEPMYMLYSVQVWLKMVLDLIIAGVCVLFAGLVVKLRSSSEAGMIGLGFISIITMSTTSRRFMVAWTTLEISLGALSRIHSFVTDSPSEDASSGSAQRPTVWPTEGKVEFSNVSATYTAQGRPVLSDINLTIHPREKILICGRSGSGKSSLVSSLLRLLHVSSGTIRIDDLDTSTMSVASVRSALTVLPQDPFFISGSIRDNMNLGTSVSSDEQIQAALRKVGLWTYVEKELGGLESTLDPKMMLSQGQQQLFCLSRMILQKGKIIIIDEASSSVDNDTDARMNAIIRSELDDRTVICVAHRLDHLLDYDRVVVLQSGRIVEVGEPKALLQRPSMFQELWQSMHAV
ncbi:P-loop containing nucleoside triphosphate hydrolase protein [Aspergillus sclerotioniger CBS 115572]|uniref:P-loop containing nucleoside triphosphate hydrolase protein n=1 Tax=Aspergillus sclerotioniger CBS 115572 TaxID=1450535 RepID=A0A317WW76_9EURO|nr:P-loop containing nucleoside triphosphate hydrolase protein [Aspergillus sclerotioniger CBS 115572]PWY89417.1 P-loop containing nucleoside triphosphate hydrolase protein [Aspergillus sclerotioniger CBS 115572]